MTISMIAVGVKDMARSIAFYGETLGMKMLGQPGEVTLFEAGGIQIVLNRPLANATSGALAGAVEIISPVESVAGAHANLAERGCAFIALPHEIYAGTWAATFTDPDGHLLTILGPG